MVRLIDVGLGGSPLDIRSSVCAAPLMLPLC